MTNVNLGGLFPGEVELRSGTLKLEQGSVFRTDSYAFSTGTANVAISASSSKVKIFLSLFKDNDANGVANFGDTKIESTSGGTSQAINRNIPQGNYVAKVSSSIDTGYNIRLARASSQANPLTSKEIQMGTISKDLTRGNAVSDRDTADNFAFTLDGNSSLNIAVRELGNRHKGDVNIRVVQDRNGNGVVDRNEVIVKGTSTFEGNIDTITNFKSAGDYILQVCQSKGDVRFGVIFDHSAA